MDDLDYTASDEEQSKAFLKSLEQSALKEAAGGNRTQEEIWQSSSIETNPYALTQKISEVLPKEADESHFDYKARQQRQSAAGLNGSYPVNVSSEATSQVYIPIAQTTGKLVEWLLAPLGVFGAGAIAPFVTELHEKDANEEFIDYTAESFKISGQAMMNSLFPTYGEPQPNYSGMIVERFLPDAHPFVKTSAGLVLDVVSDPGFVVSLGFGRVLQKGAQLARAEMAMGHQKSTAGLIERGLQETLLMSDIPETEVSRIMKLAQEADVGNKEAITILSELMDNPKYKKIIEEANTKDLEQFRQTLIDSFGFVDRTVLEDGTVILKKEFDKEVGRITADVQKEYSKRLKAEYTDELKRQGLRGKALKEKLKDFKGASKVLTKEEQAEIHNLAQSSIRIKQTNKYNRYIEEQITLSKFDNHDYLNRAIESGDIFRALKLRKGYVTPDNFPEAIQTLADSYRELYKRFSKNENTIKAIMDQASDIPINNIIEKKPGVPWTPAETFIAKGVLVSLNDEVYRLLTKYAQTKNPYDATAAIQAFDMLRKVVVREGEAGSIWGVTGVVRQTPFPTDKLLNFNNIQQMLHSVATVQDEGMQRMLEVMTAYYLDSVENGTGLNFLSRVGKGPSLIEDMLFESYVNGNLAAISTSIKNTASTGVMTMLQPAERFLSVAAGNWRGFSEGYNMAVGMSGGMRDVLYFWADQAAKTRIGRKAGNTLIGKKIADSKAAQAARMRLTEMVNEYPAAFFDPINSPRHEHIQIQKRKNISAGNLGIDPDSKWRKRIDKFGNFVRVPGSILAYQDAAFKMVAYRGSIRESAANAAFMMTGKDKSGYNKYFQEALVRPGVVAEGKAIDFADYVTFQKALGKTGSDIQRLAQARYSRWFFPYVRTPMNLVKVAGEHTPLNGIRVSYRRLFKGASPKEFQEGMSRAIMGSMVMGGMWMAFDESEVVGGYDFSSEYGKRMRELGIPPYSIKVHGVWHSYEGIDFLRSTIGMVATAKRMLAQLDLENPEEVHMADKIQATVLGPFLQTSVDQRWLNDVGRILYYIESIRGEDSSTAARATAANMMLKDAGKMLSASVPWSRFWKTLETAYVDDESRVAEGFLGELAKSIPGLAKSTDMPSYVNLWGDPYIADDSVGPDVFHETIAFIKPWRTSEEKTDIVSRELRTVPVNLPGLTRHLDGGVSLSKKQQIQIQIYTGKGVQGAAPLYDQLEKTIGDSTYQRAHPKARAAILQNVITAYKRAAINQLLLDSKNNDTSYDSLWNRYERAKEYGASLYNQ